MELKNIINFDYPNRSKVIGNKIQHELNNQGCRCNLCQKIVIKQNTVIQKFCITDIQSQNFKGKKQEYYTKFLHEFYFMDKLARKIKFMIPQVCIFEKGMPTTLITKKRQIGPMKIIKTKQKLNAFEIQNFFTDGYITHNDIKQNQKDGSKFKNLSREQYYNYRQVLSNQCIIITRYNNGTCQMMTLSQLNNLFKSKQRNLRNQIHRITTLVNQKEHNEIRVHVDLTQNVKNPLFERAKVEVKIINEDIKQKDFMYVSEKDERLYQDQLKEKDKKAYLQYISIKLLLLYSIKTDIFLESCLFKYIKGQGDSYYLTDIQVYKKASSIKVWGEVKNAVVQKTPEEQSSPTKKKKRPSSSPQKLQAIKAKFQFSGRQQKSMSNVLTKQSDKIKQIIYSRVKATSFMKLQPISIKLKKGT